MSLPEILPDLAPPPGGLESLRQRVERRRQFRSALASVLAVVVTAWIFVGDGASHDPEPRLDGPLARLLDGPGGPGLRIGNGVAQAVPMSVDNVRVYWVADLGPADRG